MKHTLYFSALPLRDGLMLIFRAILAFFYCDRGAKSDANRQDFEKQFTEILRLEDTALCVASARCGLYAILKALGVTNTDKVAVTGFTCSAVVEPIVLLGAEPLFLDVAPTDFCIDPAVFRQADLRDVKVLIVQHTFGFSADCEALISFAKQRSIFVIEDCALALGSTVGGRHLGTLGDAAIWSFELSKTISVGWGGAIYIRDDKELYDKVTKVTRNAGFQTRVRRIQRMVQAGTGAFLYRNGPNTGAGGFILAVMFRLGIFKPSSYFPASDLALPDDFQWKVLGRQLANLQEITDQKKQIARTLEGILVDIGYFVPSTVIGGTNANVIRLPLLVKNRELFVKNLNELGFEVGLWFQSPVSGTLPKDKESVYKQGTCPMAEYVSKHIINLQISTRFSDEDIKELTTTLRKIFEVGAGEREYQNKLHSDNKEVRKSSNTIA